MKLYKGILGVFMVGSALFITACSFSTSTESKVWECEVTSEDAPHFANALGCKDDFTALASQPLDASIPGAISVKTIVDRSDENTLYFQNSEKYQIHWEFASEHLSGDGKPFVPSLSEFNQEMYYSPNRRFVSGAITRYDGPKVWVYEIAPYDNATADLITLAYDKLVENTYFGEELYFHPTSQAVSKEAENLPDHVKIITTDEVFEGIDYQPLNFARSIGKLVFITAHELETAYVGFRDIVVLDAVPNDISVVSGIITQEFQTPLSHINVLSQNRGTPNMGLRKAWDNTELRALDGKWVELDVGAFDYTIKEVTKDEADEWWDDNKPDSVGVPSMDLDTKELRDMEDMLNLDSLSLGEALDVAIPAYGGKASHYGGFPHMDNEKVPFPKAFGIPVYYYWQFMEQNGLNAWVAEMLSDSAFLDDAATRDSQLKALRDSMRTAPIDSAFEAMLLDKLENDFPGVRMRFRSSTNAEDLDGFTGAGLYTSASGAPNDPDDTVLDAVRKVWASVWFFRAYEERSYRNIDHQSVGMALLVHRSFPDEEANGVAITANPFDPAQVEPGFYVNVQKGEHSVVQPAAGITTDQFVYHFELPGQPIVFIARSNLVPSDETVLTTAQTYKLGVALQEIHRFYRSLYGPDPSKWYAMDTEFKFDQPIGGDPTEEPVLFIKQARPYPGFGE